MLIEPAERVRRTATFVVAASDSKKKSDADYVCDGTADDVQIQAAIDALPGGGGQSLSPRRNLRFNGECLEVGNVN